jgi:hypothetical protein
MAASESDAVRRLEDEQRPNGSWGRFHSMDRRQKARIPTTEAGVRRALHLGLTVAHPVLRRARDYLAALLTGDVAWPTDEYEEPNDRWPAGKQMFIAATLAQIDRGNLVLQPVLDTWSTIAAETFGGGSYDPEAEWRAHCRLTGATTMQGTYLVMRNRHAMTLLGTAHSRLSDDVETALLNWIWHHPQGVGYLGVPPTAQIDSLSIPVLGRWIETQDVLSRFPSWTRLAAPALERLVAVRNHDGLWDFGAGNAPALRFSDSWRRRINRTIDHTTAALLLLARAKSPHATAH